MKRLVSGIRYLGTLVAASFIGSQAFAQVNLLTNPGFEAGGGSYTGWLTFGNGVQLSLPSGDNIIRTGVAASKIFGEFTGCPIPQFSVGGFYQAFTPTPGRTYELRAFTFISTADPIPGTDTCNRNRALAKIAFFNAASGGSEIASNEIVIGDGNAILNTWREFSVSAPAPPGALRVEALFLFLQPGCDTGAVYIDDTAFHEQLPPAETNVLSNPSFSTGLMGWTVFGNVFSESRAFLVRTPTGCAKLFSTFVPGADSGMYQSFAASAGTRWKVAVHSMTTCREDPISGTNDNLGLARIVFRDAAQTDIGGKDLVLVDNKALLGTWTLHTAWTDPAPAGTATVDVYILFVSPSLLGGAMFVDDVVFRQLSPTDVVPEPSQLAFQLHQNIPNPFNPTTRIDFELALMDAVDLSIYDVTGRRVVTLVQATLSAGPHFAMWDGKTATGVPAAAGVYQYVLRTSAGQVARRMVLVQ
jgi:hypothetical protein